MKNSSWLILVLSIFIFTSTASGGERPKEFRGLVWGTHISKVKDLVLQVESFPTNAPPEVKEIYKEREKRGDKKYIRPSDDLGIAGGVVNTIQYIFVKDQLAEVVIRFDTNKQYLAFKSLFNRLYGPPDKEEKDLAGTDHYWLANTDDEANVNLFYSEILGTGSAVMKWKGMLKREPGL